MTFLLIIPLILLLSAVFSFINMENSIILNKKSSKNVIYAADDIENNVPIIARKVIEDMAYNVIDNNVSYTNSSDSAKKIIELKINEISKKYENKGIKSNCIINYLKTNGNDPFLIDINFSLDVEEGNVKHQETITKEFSIEGLPDPLPFIKLRKYGNLHHDKSKIYYGDSLAAYLSEKGLKNVSYYKNAISPFLIKKCPYEEYTTHNNTNILLNCLKNGYYHESHDGACYFYRLNGKGVSDGREFGIETFIVPSTLIENVSAPVSVDHVLFSDTNTYYGFSFCFNSTSSFSGLFLDNGHRKKYGILLFLLLEPLFDFHTI